MCEYALYVQGTVREQSFIKWGGGEVARGGGEGEFQKISSYNVDFKWQIQTYVKQIHF